MSELAGRFTTRPAVVPQPDDRWSFADDLVWVQDTGLTLTVPAGFVMDGASIPRLFWSTIGHPMEGEFVYAAGLHDWECCTRRTRSPIVHQRFREALKSEGVGAIRRAAMYRAVRLFGPRFAPLTSD